jgi:leucyl-tRNA synthetase
LIAKGLGRQKTHYKMRDWLISRQRYWGTPIPIVYCETCGEVPESDTDLPILLPTTEDFRPDGSGRSPLARIPNFLETTCPRCGGSAHRETDTMGGFACSSWYFLRFTSPHYDLGPFDKEAMRYWMPVDLYVGGAEHAVLHLLYARFWTKFLADAGLVPFREPFSKLKNQGQLMGPDGHRMSKSRGNVITPDDIVGVYGADTLRVHEIFIAPFEQDVDWSDEGIMGARRFLNRLWNLVGDTYQRSISFTEVNREIEKKLHKTIRLITERIEGFKLNTMISELMEFVNFLYERYHSNTWKSASYHQALEILIIMVAPAAPYISEELWKLTGHTGSVHTQNWPQWDADLAIDDLVEIAISVVVAG